MEEAVIVAAARTAVGKFGGSLAKVPAPDLGAVVIKGLLERSGIAPDVIDEVILGQVLTAGSGQNPARQAAIKAGIPHHVPSFVVGKVCGSGLKATHLATQSIRLGDASIVIAAASAHRADAFAACRYTIERVKQIVPIWKHEHFEGGDVWLEGATADPEDDAARQAAHRIACA